MDHGPLFAPSCTTCLPFCGTYLKSEFRFMMWRFLPKNTRVEQPSRKTHLLDMSGSLQSPVGFYLHAENNCGRAIANLDFIFWACQSICPDAKESRHCSVCLQQQTWECGGYVEDHREVNKIYRFKSGNQILLLSLFIIFTIPKKILEWSKNAIRPKSALTRRPPPIMSLCGQQLRV